MKLLNRNRVTGIIFLAIGIVMLIFSRTAVDVSGTDSLGERFIPYVCSICVIGFSAYLAIAGKADIAKGDEKSRINDYIRVFTYLGVVIISVVIMNFAGFLPGAIAMIVLNLLIQGKGVPKWWFLVALGFLVAIYSLFTFGIGVKLP